MARLKAALLREYEDDTEYQMQVYNPRNTVAVELHFRGEKMAKVLLNSRLYLDLTESPEYLQSLSEQRFHRPKSD